MERGALVGRLAEARERRRPLLEEPQTRCYRLVHGEADGLGGLSVDWFDGVAVASLYTELDPSGEERLLDGLEEAYRPRATYLKRRPREARVVASTRKDDLAPSAPARGEAIEACHVLERGLSFEIRPGQGLSVGLYLDAREARSRVRRLARGAKVLNAFAYTCGFGVAALAGGAEGCANVDLSRRVLDWGRRNAELNGLLEGSEYLVGDVFGWLGRLAKKGRRFDLVVLDPPSFATAGRRRFSAARDYPGLVRQAAGCLSEGGTLVACCNLAKLTSARFQQQIWEGLGAAGRAGARLLPPPPAPLDFPAGAELGPALKVVVVRA